VAGKSYLVLNRTRETRIAESAEEAGSVFSRMKGLIGRTSVTFPSGSGFWINPSEGVHTIGMRIPIDAAYLDAEGRILRLYHGLRPFRIAAVSLKTRSVLELPSGTLARTATKVGDLLEFHELTAS
jgi:uncharacterized protein